MADANANIRIDVDATAALAQIKQLQRQISLFHSNMVKGGAAAAAEAQNLQRNLVNSINATGQFSAGMTRIKTTTESFTNALEKNKLSMGQYFRYAGGATQTFGKLFKTEFATINKVARERVKDLQTQYIKMGRDANGAMQAIKVRPLTLDLQNLGTQTAIAAQKQALFNTLIRQGSVNLLNWGKNTQWAGRQLMVGFTIPLTIFGATAVREFAKIEEQAIRFKRVYGDMFTSNAETEQAIKNIRELANEFTKYGVAVEKTIDLAATVAQLGAQGTDLTNQVREATRLAVLGGIEQQEALDTTISLTNAFGLATEDLSDKIAFLNAVENQTILSIEDFNIAIPKAGAVVQQLGGDIEDLAFFLTAMREGGINASESANALKSGLASIINPTQQSIDKMKEFGIDVVGIVDQNAGNLRETVMSLAGALNSLDALDRARAIEQLFGKFQFARISTLFQNITKEGSQANKVLEIASYNARELGIIAERELGRVEASELFKFQKAVEEFQAALAPVGEAFLKLVTPIIEFGTRILDRFNDMSDGAKTFVVGLTAVLGVVAPAVLMLVGLLANGIANLLLFSTKVSGAFSKTGGASNVLTEQINYMNSEQIEAAAVAASLDQVHQRLIQTFNAEAGAIGNLTGAYGRAIASQQAFLASRGVAGGAGAPARGGAPKPSINPFMPPKYADGILSVPGPKGAGDIVAAMLSPGEAVIPAAMAKKYAPFINSIIADNVPGFFGGRFALPKGREFGHMDPGFQVPASALVPFGEGRPDSKIGNIGAMFANTGQGNRPVNAKTAWGRGQDPELNKLSATGKAPFEAQRQDFLQGGPQDFYPALYEAGADPETIAQDVQEYNDEFNRLFDAAGEAGAKFVADTDANLAKKKKAVQGKLGDAFDEERFDRENVSIESIDRKVAESRTSTPTVEARQKALDTVKEYRPTTLTKEEEAIVMESGGEKEKKTLMSYFKRSDKVRNRGAQAEVPGAQKELAQNSRKSAASPEATAAEDAQAALDASEAILSQPQNDPFMQMYDENARNSPHNLAGPSGGQDGEAYKAEFDAAVSGKSGPLAPPPPPSAPGESQSGGRFSQFKDKAKSIGNRAMDKFLETAPGQGIGNYFAETSGADITNSRGEVIASPKEQAPTQQAPRQYPPGQSPSEIQARNQALVDNRLATFDADTGKMTATLKGLSEGLKQEFSVLDVEITELGNTAQKTSQQVDEHTQSVRENGDAATQSGAEMDSATGRGRRGRRGRGGQGDTPEPRRRGITGGGAGLSMGLSALTMGASMAPGALGEQAQKAMPALMALSAAPMLFQALQSPLVALLAVVVAIGGSIFMLNKTMKDAQNEAMELGRAMGAGADAMKSLAEFAGTVSAGEFMDKAREERLKGVETAPGKTTFGESFVQDEKGQALIASAKTQIAKTGDVTATINSLTNQLATAVMTGVLTKEQASSMAANLGFALNNMEIGLQVRANIAQLVGPNGEDITAGDLVEFSAKVNADNMKAVDDQIEVMNRNLEGVFGDELGEMVLGSVGGGLAGGVAGGLAGLAVGTGAAALAASGAKIGALIGTAITPGIGTAVGIGIGAAIGGVGAFVMMKKNAEEAGKLSGAVVATVVNALQQQQEMSDAVDAYYLKKLDEAKIQGDITEQLRLQSEYEQKKVELSEQEMAMREQLRGALTGPGAEAARVGIASAIDTRFQDDADAKMVLPGIEAAMKTLDFSEAETDTINFELATGSISPMALNSLLTFIGEDDAKKQALIDVFGTFGGVFADEASQVLALIDDEDIAADIFVNISQSGNEQEAQEILDFVREIQRQDSVFDTDIILNYMTENEDVAEGLQEIFDLADMGVVSVDQAYEINPKLENAEAFDALYFESLPDVDKEQYVKTISMILEMDEAELLASEDFKKWTGDEGQVHGPFPGGKHSLAAWQRLYAESMGQKVTSQLSSADTTIGDVEPEEEAGGGGGGGPQASSLDDLLKKLREVRQSTIEMTQGWVESRNALDRLFNDGGEIKIFQGVEQQMRKLGAGEDLISMIVGMDPEEYERRKHELFQFDNMGNIIGATTALENMGKALRAIALGDFQSEQQRVIGGMNEQLVAFRKLTAAGLSAAMAYEALKDAAFASAVAREKDNNVIREAIKLTAKAVTLNRALAAAQAVARKNQETADLSGVARFIEQNAASLSDVQKQAILSDPDLQTLIMNPSVDPKTLRKALANAADQAELDLKIKKLTFDGLQEIFQDGFSKAMEAFSAKETEITIEFDVKKDPFLDIIQEAEEAISDIRNRAGGLDDLDADMERISRQEADINKTYDSRIEALDKIEKINQTINRNKKSQLDVADALSRGDIAGAARAARQAAEEAASASLAARRDQLELSREQEISSLVGNMGLTREQLEERIKNLQIEIFEIEEQRLEPAQRQVELLDRSQAVLIESLTVLGRTREEWEAIQNQVNLANVNSERFQAALQEALNVVEDIQTYWEDLNGTEVDLFVNVQQQGSVDDIIASIAAGRPARDPGSGGGGKSDEELLAEREGRGAAYTEQTRGETLAGMRPPSPYTRSDAMAAGAAVAARNEREQAEAALSAAQAELQRLQDRPERSSRSARTAAQAEVDEQFLLVQQEMENLANAEEAFNDAQAKVDANAARRAQGDPMALYNTGAANLLDATAFLFENIARDAEGKITGNIGGYFADLGVKAPTLMAAIPGFFNMLPEDIKNNVQGQITEQFRILAANVEGNLVGIGNVFTSMPEDARLALEQSLGSISGFSLSATQSLDNISEWWGDLAPDIQSQVLPLIQEQLLSLGEQASLDLEGTIGQYWDVLPATVKDALEGQITPTLVAEAEKMGISVEELLIRKFQEMPEATREAITEGLAGQWNEMSVKALQAIAAPEGRLLSLGNKVDPNLQINIGNALRGAAAIGTEEFKRVQGVIAGLPEGTDVVAAFSGTRPGSLGALARAGAEIAATELELIPETIGGIPEDQLVTDALGKDLPADFAASGTESGRRFGVGAVSRIQQALRNYQATVPSIEVKVIYTGQPHKHSNDGGFISRNLGGITPYRRGGVAKYAKGGMTEYAAGGVIGGFGNYDNVPAMLTPGEFVIRKEAVEKYGKNFFANLNSTIYNKKPKFSTPEYGMSKQEASIKSDDSSKSQVMYNNNYSVSVNVKSDSNPDQIARTVIDQIKRIDSQRIRGNRF